MITGGKVYLTANDELGQGNPKSHNYVVWKIGTAPQV